MPRITAPAHQVPEQRPVASMRPGRNAPDNAGLADGQQRALDAASMRPGRNAPDNGPAPAAPPTFPRASMRPGRNAPDNTDADLAACVEALLQ